LESISQAAQETRRPATIIPRTSLGLIFSVLLFAMAFSVLGIGMLPWQRIAEAQGDPVALLAHNIPLVGVIAGPFAAMLGATILLISANTGVMGSSRLTFSMSEWWLASRWLDAVHPTYRTPYRTIIGFSAMAIVEAPAAMAPSRHAQAKRTPVLRVIIDSYASRVTGVWPSCKSMSKN